MECVQIIDEEKNFNHKNSGEKLESVLRNAKENHIRVVAILGPQSSGKSTLLNGLFDTTFSVMDEMKRKQTTLGIWGSYSTSSNIIVLDVEGTDGRERGDSQDFERKSALFSLATAEVLIINIWENSVGLYHGANMSLLRTVMDVHIQISDKSKHSNTVLLFVIRDYAGKTPKSNISSVLIEDLQKIWTSLKKSSELENKELTEIFSIQFEFLPHKILQSGEFKEAIQDFRSRFNNSLSENYIFTRILSDLVDKSDWIVFARNVWERILSNKDLDLPTERELLAQFRCDEISRIVVQNFNHKIRLMRDEIDSGFVPNFLASQINKLVADSKVTYTEQTIRYARNIVDLIWKDTIYKFSESAYDLACRNMDLVIKNILASLESDMNIVPQKISYGIALQQALEKAERKFNDCLTECQMPDWDINLNAKRIEFTDQLDNKSLLLKKEECFRLSNTANKKYLGSFSRTFGSLLFGMDNEDELKRMYLNVIESELEALVALTESTRTELILSEEALKTWMNTEIDKFNEEIVKIIKYEFSERKIIDRIVAKFEHDFLYDESKLPRVWNDVQAVDIYYQDAISFAFKKLRQFEDDENWLNDFKTGRLGKIYPKIPSPFLDIELISSIEIHLQKIFDRRYIEAKKSTLSSNTHIPAWVYLLILVLGWNEIISIISSPLYLIISIILLSIAISIYTFNLMPYIQIGLTFVVNTLQSNALNSKAPTSSKSEHNY